MAHGFRVFTVDLLQGMGRKTEETWDLPSGEHYADYVARVVDDLTSRQDLLRGKIKWAEAQALTSIIPVTTASPGDLFVRWMSSGQTGRRISMELKYGTVGSYSDATGLSGDTSIADHAPGRLYRAELALPEVEGPGLLAVETISRACPAPSVVTWTGAASAVAENGGPWWRMRAAQVIDGSYLSELIARSDKAEVKLRKVQSVDANEIGDRRRTRYRLTAQLDAKQRLGAMGWVKSKLAGGGGIEGMLQVLGVGNTGELEFNDGHILVDDGEVSTRIGLSDVRETFTYPISTDRPDDQKWWESVSSRFHQLQPELNWS